MYHPTRGGTRGGQAEFTWDQVRSDQHRENYLGHSVFAPTGRWQNNKDVNWYNKDAGEADQAAAAEKRRQELREVKMREEEEMNKRLGIKPGQGFPGSSSSSSLNIVGERLLKGSNNPGTSSSLASTGANRAPIDASRSRWNRARDEEEEQRAKEEKEARYAEERISKEDRRAARKLAKIQVRAERHEERRQRREERIGGARKGDHHASSDDSDNDNRRDDSRRHRPSRRDHDDRDRTDRLERKRERDVEGPRNRDRDRDIDRDKDDRGRHHEGRDRERDYPRYERDDRRSERNSSDRRDDAKDARRYPDIIRRDRSRSPGRSLTPEMQRRRRERGL